MLTDLRSRLTALVRSRQVERHLDDELRFHLETSIERYVADGMDRREAERRARLEFGGLDQVKEDCRDALGVRLLVDLWRDGRYAVRSLRRTPVFALTAIISIALGVGANALVFSVTNALVLRPLPIVDPEQVVFVQRGGSFVSHSFPFYRELRDRNAAFEALAGYRIAMMEVDARQRATHEWGYLVTGNYFPMLRIQPAAGRFFGPEEDRRPGASPYAVLSYDYWQSRFDGEASIVGTVIRINRLPYTVVGVAPAGFYGTEQFYRPRLWVPMMMQAQIEVGNPWLEDPGTTNTWVVGRLRSDVTRAAALSHLEAVAQGIAEESDLPRSTEIAPLRLTRPGLLGDGFGAPARAFAFGLVVLAALVLATACANLASSLAARGMDRRRELAIRLSIGAGRGRVVRQLLTECLALAGIGGGLGATGAFVATRIVSQWQLPTALPLQLDVRPDLRVLAFTLAATVVTGVAVGVSPAHQASRTSPAAALKSAAGALRRSWPVREVLVSVQVALCFLLVVACVVAIHGLSTAVSMPLGMKPAEVTMVAFDLGLARYSEADGIALQRRARDRIAQLPGVLSAAYGNSLPLNIDQSTSRVTPDDRPELPRTERPSVVRYQVSPGYLETLGVPLLRGRDVQWSDEATAPPVALVNEAFARQVLRTDNAVGRRFRFGTLGPLVEIVGMVRTGKYRSLTEAATPAVFVPILQSYNTTTVVLARSVRPSAAVAEEMRQALADLDPSLALFNVQSVERMLGFVLLPTRVAAVALSAFGVLAIVLAATGIYGIVAYSLSHRRRELAIRVAVGASHASIVRLSLQRVAGLVAIGAVAGAGLAVLSQRLLGNIVYQGTMTPLATYAVVTALVLVVAMAACWAPMCRILKLDPARALSVE